MIRSATKYDVSKMYNLSESVISSKVEFIKSTKEEILDLVSRNESFVFEENGNILAFILITNFYIDTIISSKKGLGSVLLSSLPVGNYKVHISETNSRSRHLFEKYNFKQIGKDVICSEARLVYENNIQ